VKLKLIIIGVVALLFITGGYFVFNTGLLSDYNRTSDVIEPGNAASNVQLNRFEDPNRSVKAPIFRTILEQENVLFLRGTSEANAVVSILGNGERRRQTRADKDGIWEAEIDMTADNILAISLASFLSEDLSFYGDELLIRALPDTSFPLDDEEISGELDGDDIVSNRPPALVLLTAPGGPSRVIQTPFSRLPTQGALTLGAIEYDDLGGVIFSGFASRAGRVRIFGDNELIGESRVGSNGRWYLIAAETLPLGPYNLKAQLQEADGRETNLEVNIQRLPPRQNADQSPYVVFNDNVWHVRRDLKGGGVQYTAILSPDSLVTLPAE